MLGQYMVAALIEAGLEVRALVRPTSDIRHLEGQPVEIFYSSADRKTAVSQAMEGVNWVFHLAGYLTIGSPFGSEDHSPNYKEVNVDLTETLLDAGLKNGIARFIYASSSNVYDPEATIPTPEETALRPQSAYGRSKAQAERLVLAYQNRGLATTIVRPAVVYGRGDRYFTPIALRLSRLPFLTLVNGGRNLFDLVYAGEVARLMLLACQTEAAVGRAYNAGPGARTTLFDLVTAFRRLTGHGPRIVPVTAGTARRLGWMLRPLLKRIAPGAETALTPSGIDLMSRDIQLDMTRARIELGYEPQIDLDQGLARTLEGWPEK